MNLFRRLFRAYVRLMAAYIASADPRSSVVLSAYRFDDGRDVDILNP